MKLRMMIIAGLFIVWSCSLSIIGLDTATRLHKVDVFRKPFVAAVTCAGIGGDSARSLFSRVKWYRAPQLPGDTAGLWVGPYSVYLRKGRNSPSHLIRHEALHVASQSEHGHPFFGRPDDYDGCETSWESDD